MRKLQCKPTKKYNHEVKKVDDFLHYFSKNVYYCYTCNTWWFRK